jgi:hypothetical protein
MRKRQDEAANVASSPEAEATIAVGLKPKVLTKQELQVFGNRMNDYLDARFVPAEGLAPCKQMLPANVERFADLAGRFFAETRYCWPGIKIAPSSLISKH